MIAPEKLGLVREKGSDENINLKNYLLGNKRVLILSEVVKNLENLGQTNMDLKNNRIDRNKSKEIFSNLQNINKLDLSNN